MCIFKGQLPRNIIENNPASTSFHHIEPICNIKNYNEMTDPRLDNATIIENKRKRIEDFVNKALNQNFKEIIINEFNDIENENDEVKKSSRGEILKAAIIYFSNNLCNGPLPETRIRDPKQGVDIEILEFQSTEYIQEFKKLDKNKSLEQFALLPAVTKVDWFIVPEHINEKKKYLGRESN